jgi:bifunctional non-homologous end joining protein LigD
MNLKEYRKKRNFDATPEPSGAITAEGQAPLCFVVHKHHASHLHFDLRLELDGVLKSWALPKGPSLDPAEKKLAIMVEDHPFDYRTFEGVIPEGNYGAGTVMIWDRGNYHAVGHATRRESADALRQGLMAGHISFVLDGQRLKGEFALVTLKRAGDNSWLLIKKSDAFAHTGGTPHADTSVASGRTMEEIATDGAEGQGKRRGRLVAINDVKVDLTNLDKVLWPEEGYTKGDMIAYYRSVAPFILPYLRNRPESLHRHPDGVASPGFFQKNVDHAVPGWVETLAVRSGSEGRDVTYLLCQDEATLVYMANLGCIEINPWHARAGRLDMPDYMVLDLDPLDIPFDEVVRVALVTHDVLVEIGAAGFCKTSGATGLHIYVPLGARYSYDQATQFARLVNFLVHTRLPRTTSIERDPAKRKAKVYLDFLQNGYGQTLAAPYCLRPRKGAPVSTPLAWVEVHESLDPTRFTIETMMARLRKVGDLWKDVLGPGIDMERCLSRLDDMMRK